MRTIIAVAVVAMACKGAYALPPDPPGTAHAVFGGGCFWCIESDFEKLEGVVSVVSGYAGGAERDPTYQQVSAGTTGHAEVVRVVYDPKQLSYNKLVDYFFKHIDPTTKDASFCDRGRQYRTAVFYATESERLAAYRAKADAANKFRTVFTEVTQASEFWPAEEYHQDYYKKSPASYAAYRQGCGRDTRVRQLWGTRSSP